MTNLGSTLSYRGTSSDHPARTAFNHVGIKRSGPKYEYNAENDLKETEKLYYRHKRDPYRNLQNFINGSKAGIESKIQELRLKERQKMLQMRKKYSVQSNSFYNKPDDLMGKSFDRKQNLSRLSRSPDSKPNMLNQTEIIRTGKFSGLGSNLNENDPSSVNARLPSKFVIDYPNFLKPAKYYPYRRLEDHHIADAIEEARNRHERKLLSLKSEDEKYTQIFNQNLEENKKAIQSAEETRKKVYDDYKRSLQEQIMQKRMMNVFESKERRRYVKTHFGPEETEERTKMHSDKKSHEKEHLREALMSQIEEKRANIMNQSRKERAEAQKQLEMIAEIM